ncbi:MAG: helix-hairpin-helix domain-containing protein [Candidatus Thorarchaeota archaeon]
MMSTNKSDFRISPLSIMSIAVFIVIGAALWWINTVAAVVIIIIAVSSGALLLWYSLTGSMDYSAGFSNSIYNEQFATRRRLSEIENRMRAALEEPESEYEDIMSDYEYSDLSEESMSDYDTEIPVGIIDGINADIAEKMAIAGIEDLDELAVADSDEISQICKVKIQTAEEWILDAKTIFVGAQISSIIDLSMEDAEAMRERIMKSVRDKVLKFPIDFEIPVAKVQRWINRANSIVSAIDVNEMQRWLEESDR